MALCKLKTEHAGAKNGGGAWDTRYNAKRASRKARRSNGKRLIRKALAEVK
jgi:hypothetical protein